MSMAGLTTTPEDAGRVAALAEVFRAADARMTGLPIHNPALSVDLRGFGPWNKRLLGVVVTPWSMNLTLLPAADDPAAWDHLNHGAEIDHELPCGRIRFVVARSEDTGLVWQACSLFSPMTDFADMEGAQATADAVLDQVLTPVDVETAPVPERAGGGVSRRAMLGGGS